MTEALLLKAELFILSGETAAGREGLGQFARRLSAECCSGAFLSGRGGFL